MKTKLCLLFVIVFLIIPVNAISEPFLPYLAGFETGSLDELTYDIGGEISADAAYAGSYGLKNLHNASIAVDNRYGYINLTDTLNASVTFYVKIQNLDTYHGFEFQRVKANANDAILLLYILSDGNFTVSYTDDDAGGDLGNNVTNLQVVENQWYKIKMEAYLNQTNGYYNIYINDVLFWSKTGLDNQIYPVAGYSEIDQFYFHTRSIYSDLEVYIDQIEINYVYAELDYNFWFIITGVITFFFVSGFALFALKGRIRR